MHLIIEFVYLMFVAVINSFDNMGVRVAYSIGGIRINMFKNVVISLMAFAVAFSGAFFASILAKVMSEQLSSMISMILFIIMGFNLICKGYKKKSEITEKVEEFSYKEAVFIGTALAIDDIGGAVGVGLVGHNPLVVGTAFFIVSFIIFLAGNYAIKLFSKLNIAHYGYYIAGSLMIILGLLQLIS